MKFKHYITVPKEYLELNKYELLIIVHLYMEKYIDRKISVFTILTLAQLYNINTESKKRSLSDAFNSLIEKNIISAIKKNNSWIVDLDKIEAKKSYFFRVYNCDIYKIFESEDINLFRYYCIIMSSINSKTRESRISITMLGKKYNLGRKTILRYNNILEQMKILKIDHGNYLNCNIYRNCNEYELKNNWDSAHEKFEELPAV